MYITLVSNHAIDWDNIDNNDYNDKSKNNDNNEMFLCTRQHVQTYK